jgi:hypothetical protein
MDLDRDVLDGLDKLAKECLGADWAACDELAGVPAGRPSRSSPVRSRLRRPGR